jgi:hypothetical protein
MYHLEYPVGSVVATVTVFLKGIETLEFKLPSNISSVSGTESELIKQMRINKFAVKYFLGHLLFFCI